MEEESIGFQNISLRLMLFLIRVNPINLRHPRAMKNLLFRDIRQNCFVRVIDDLK